MKKIYKIIIVIIVLLTTTFMVSRTLDKYLYEKYNQDINQSTQQTKKYENLILVNKENSLNSNYIPEKMVVCNIPFLDTTTEEQKYLQKEAARSIEELFQQAKKEGIEFLGTSAYRSYETQKQIFNENVKIRGIEEANKYAAKPGKSEHQTGLAIDVTNHMRWFDKTTKEAIWLAENAHKFGFILRFPEGKEHITGYNFEPWHVRYVGKEVAKEIYYKGLTLEEYLQNE